MKNVIAKLSTLLITTTLAIVGDVEADTSFQFGIGYRTDDFSWKIGLPTEILPESKSKLWFKDLEIFTINGRIKSACDCIYYRIDGQYGWIVDGDVRESDRFCDPVSTVLTGDTAFTCSFPKTHNSVKGKYVADFSVALGYPLEQCWCPNVQIVPTIGFAYDTLRFRAHGHESIFDDLATAQVPILGFDPGERRHRSSSFRATFWGPFIGLDFAWCSDCWNLYGEFEYHFVRARRDRNTHIVHFLDHYRRTRHAYGFNLKIGSTYRFCYNWFLDGNLSYKQYDSNRCRDSINWRSFGVGLDLGYMF
jgi:hypothetical protein